MHAKLTSVLVAMTFAICQIQMPVLAKRNITGILEQVTDDLNIVTEALKNIMTSRQVGSNKGAFLTEEKPSQRLRELSEVATQLQAKLFNIFHKKDDIGKDKSYLRNYMKDIKSDADLFASTTDMFLKEIERDFTSLNLQMDGRMKKQLHKLKTRVKKIQENVHRATSTLRNTEKKGTIKQRGKDKDGAKSNLLHQPRGFRNSSSPVEISRIASYFGPDGTFKDKANNRSVLADNPSPSALTMTRSQNPFCDSSWLARYMRACPTCTVIVQGNHCPLYNQALEMKKWVNELHELLSYGCKKPEGCTDPGICCISEEMPLEQMIAQATHLLKDMYTSLYERCATCSAYTIHDNWQEWGQWSMCSVTCGHGFRQRARRCSSGRCAGEAVATEACPGLTPCCVEGGWSSWDRWPPCPATCGRSVITRRRRCDSPSPGHCGRPCPGVAEETRACGLDQECCVDGNWGSWASWVTCSTTCGPGIQSQMRKCDNPSPNFCGRRCAGPVLNTRECDLGTCCVDGNWGSWLRWTPCSSSCGPGVRSRLRRCDNPIPSGCGRSCEGQPVQQERCQSTADVDGNWGAWLSWSACSATCGQGTRSRRRRCDSPTSGLCGRSCTGLDYEIHPCDSRQPCCVSGNWGTWTPWTACSMTCGVGRRERRRSCDNPSPNYCGQRCPGQSFEEGDCDTRTPCQTCVDGNWGTWQPWLDCSATCGAGRRQRRRSCDDPPANNCGQKCPGLFYDVDNCDTGRSCQICVDGNWGTWTPWAACSVTCGVGRRERRRPCNNPSPNYCGQKCPGQSSEVGICDTGTTCQICVDGNWGTWTHWAACSVTCGVGRREKRRSCNNPSPNYCGQRCPGQSSEEGICDTGTTCQICVDGNWGTWTPWTACSVTCGVGSRERRRPCNNPSPNYCGQRCPGQSSEEGVCDTGTTCQICVNGNWGTWQPWAACSVTCGVGRRERQRSCDRPPANYCGQRCPGQNSEDGACDTGTPCQICVAGNWGTWQPWASCSVTCGVGRRGRQRSCDRPPANYCGQQCQGQSSEEGDCDTDTPCQICVDGNWGTWQSWRTCSVTCGVGRRERRRSCDNPPYNSCGQQCPGQSSEEGDCDSGTVCQTCVDGNWGTWQAWTQCSVTCGRGTIERRRACNNPPANYCGQRCPGQEFETEVCENDAICEICVDGNWGTWQSWSPCSATCGLGTIERRRSCNNPPANYCGQRCPGREFETESCQSSATCEVCVEGQWTTWSQWASCSATCGAGSQVRTRTCSHQALNPCRTSCPGDGDERRACQATMSCDCEIRQWTTWTSWGVCSATCGNSIRVRTRSCRTARPGIYCSENECAGSDQESAHCDNLLPCPNWGQWSACSVTCRGQGTRHRIYYITQDVGRGDISIEANATRQEFENCIVEGPECPSSAAIVSWTEWDNWCPCSCRDGLRNRRRECVREGPLGVKEKVQLSLCQGEARQEEQCDVRESCPVCITSCQGQPLGEYPSCSSCDLYISCRATENVVVKCSAAKTEWDAFVKNCVSSPSPSCMLHDCLVTCQDQADARYHSCKGCNYYVDCRGGQIFEAECPTSMEWNQQLQRCENGFSPTCKRELETEYFARIETIVNEISLEGESSFINGEARMDTVNNRDTSAADAFFDETRKNSDDTRSSLSGNNELSHETEKLYKKMETDGTAASGKHIETFQNLGGIVTTTTAKCKYTCHDTEPGRYPSCKGCSYYIICTKQGVLQQRQCPQMQNWDDNSKTCKTTSSTCTEISSYQL